MRELRPQFEAAGINVRFITIGSNEKAAAFCSQFGVPDLCIGDRDRRTYRAMGLGDFNLLKLFSDRALKLRRKENKTAGFSQNWKATKLGDASQLPGAAIIDAAGEVRWTYRGKHPGDLPTMQAMLDIAKNGLHR